jgi:hypothetical protein
MSALFILAAITPPLLFIVSGQIVLTVANIGALLLIAGLATSVVLMIVAINSEVK